VTLIALDEGTQLSGLQRIVENDAPLDPDNGSAGDDGSAAPNNDDAGAAGAEQPR
jgi:DNA gyrase subunit A